MRKLLFCLLFSFSLFAGIGQSYQPKGHHFTTSYTAKQYRLNPQNFDVAQDDRGIMYLANDGGVLEFDGENWRTVKVPTQRSYALAKSSKGNIYVGALDNFGVLTTDAKGQMQYSSLSDQMDDKKVPTIRQVYSSGDWVYFVPDPEITRDYLYAYSESKKSTYKIQAPGKMSFCGMAGHIPVIQVSGKGLYKLNGQDLASMGNATAWGAITIKDFFVLNDRLYLFDGTQTYSTGQSLNEPVPEKNMNIPAESNNFCSYRNWLIYSSSRGGIQVCSTDGTLLYYLNKKFDLVDNSIRKLFIDRDKNLWAATENGISIIDISNTLTHFSYFDGLDGSVYYMGTSKKHLIVETRSGVFRLKKQISVDETVSFDLIKSITNAPYGITNLVTGNDTTLFIADFGGILKHTGNDHFERVYACAPWNLHQSHQYNDVLLVPDYTEGLVLLVYHNGSVTPVKIPEVSGRSGRQVYEDKDGVLWLSEETNGIYRIVPKRKGETAFDFSVQYFDQKSGLPNGYSFAFEFHGKNYFGTERGFYEFNPKASGGKFTRTNLLDLGHFARESTIHQANTDPQGNLWVSAYDVNDIKHYYFGYATFQNGKVTWVHQPFLKVSDEKVDCIFHENENVSWLGGPEGLFRYDKRNTENFNRNYEVLLRKMRIGEDSLIYGGAGPYTEDLFSFSFAKQHYYFEFSGTYFKTENGVRYSYFLDGFDKNWSPYTTNNYVEFTNLYEGNYTLHVKAVDDYGNPSRPFTIAFSIGAPWYRTTLAYIGYGIIFILIIVGAVRISSNGLKKIIAQRTREIEEQKLVVEEKNREIIDSISYAKRLQQAILPSQKTIHEYLPESFVLYKPKDIIAGDFFWMEVIDKTVLFAVCDCTGHGVPGAMVSVVGANSLNRCVKEFGLTQPAAILDQLTLLVEETFSHSDGEVKDGMDVSLCSLNTETLELQWAGANNPLWLLQNGELREIKADKQPIGKFDNRKPFTNHVIQLHRSDLIYLFSDGYADQFGGEKGKKFKYSQLKEIIMKYAAMAMKTQASEYETIFETWRGEAEQTDDVCMWGIRL